MASICFFLPFKNLLLKRLDFEWVWILSIRNSSPTVLKTDMVKITICCWTDLSINSSLRLVIDSCNVSILLAVASSFNESLPVIRSSSSNESLSVIRSSLEDNLPVISSFGESLPVVSSFKKIVGVTAVTGSLIPPEACNERG